MVTLTPHIGAALYDAATRLTATSSDDARLEAEVLLAEALGVTRARLLARLNEPIDADTAARYDALVERRLAREPLAYILGRREFYGVDIGCSAAALIPRPETEMLVDLALDEIRQRGSALRIVDVGTGSGAIAIAIAANVPAALVTGIDSSRAALALARETAIRVGVGGRVRFVAGDLLDGQGRFDLIVANLPYVSDADWADLPPEIRDHEPRGALVGGAMGVDVIARLIRSAPEHLEHGGLLAAEIGAEQAGVFGDFARASLREAHISVEKDLAGLDRVLVVRRKGG